MSRQRAALRQSLKALTGAAVLGALLALPASAGAAAKEPAKPAAAKAARPAKSSAPAAPACYNRAEHAAEQLMRMHTEMMVIGLTCRTVMPDKKPFDLYQDFSVKNRALLSSSEASLISYYKRSGSGGNATRQFDMFRTELANEISRRAATIGIPQYCANFVDRSAAAKDLTPDDLRTLTSDEKGAGLMHLASRPLCEVGSCRRRWDGRGRLNRPNRRILGPDDSEPEVVLDARLERVTSNGNRVARAVGLEHHGGAALDVRMRVA